MERLEEGLPAARRRLASSSAEPNAPLAMRGRSPCHTITSLNHDTITIIVSFMFVGSAEVKLFDCGRVPLRDTSRLLRAGSISTGVPSLNPPMLFPPTKICGIEVRPTHTPDHQIRFRTHSSVTDTEKHSNP